MNEPPAENRLPHSVQPWLSYRRKRFWGVIFVLAYILGGFFLVPPILRGQVVSSLQKSLDRPVTLEGAGFNPLTLGVNFYGLRIIEKDKSPLLGFDRLHVRLSPASLWQFAWSIGDITLEGLKGDLIRFGKGDTNVGRLIQTLSPKKDPTRPAKDEQGVRLIVAHLAIRNASATFTDRVPETPFTTQIGPINAEIEHFSTLPDKTGQQHIVVDLEKGSRLDWSSQSSLDPLTSSGHVKAKGPYLPLLARYLGAALKISAPSGVLEADLDYRLEEHADGDFGVSVDHLGLTVSDLDLREKDAPAPFLAVPKLQIAGGHFAWPERQAGADSLSVDGMTLALRREQDGTIAPMPWAAAGSPEQPPQQQQEKKADWTVALGKVEVRKAKATFEDRTLHDAGKIEIASLDLSAESLSNKADSAFPFSVTAGLAPGGTIKIEGKAAALPKVTLDGKLTITDLPIAIAQPYLHDTAKLAIEDGKLDIQGDVTLHDPEGLKIAGQGEVRSLKVRDEVQKGPLVSWDKLSIDRYVYHHDKNDLNISQITLAGPFVRFQIAQDHSTNFTHLFAAPAPAPGAAAPIKVTVGKITVEKGSADYGDASLPLPFATHITDMQGKIVALSSSASSASGVALHGQVDQYGEVTVSGKVNPFHVGKGMKVDVAFHNVDFPGLSPYTAKFAGRRIAQGKLDVESQYAIDDGKLSGSNKVVIREMELGEKVDVPGAMDLPLDLAISLLKDDEGRITLDLPVSGDINDPQFEMSGVIAKAVGDVLGDLVTAPFKALAGLFGGAGDKPLDHIDFAPGRADLDPPEKEKLQHVAEILQKRSKIALVVTGVVDKDADRQKLQRDALDAAMAKELGEHDMVGRQRKYLEGLAEKKLDKDQLAAVKQSGGGQSDGDDPAYMAALRHEVAKTFPIDEAGLDKLGQARGAAVVDALKQTQGFDPKRVTVKGNKEVKADGDGRIELKLEAATRD